MKFNIRGNKEVLSDSVRTYAESKIGKLNKYFENPDEVTATIVVKVIGISQIVEVTIPIKGSILRAEVGSKDIYSSIDLVLEKLESQIRKNKTKMKNKSNKEIVDLFIDFELTEEEETGKIIKRKEIDSKPMDEEEAVLQMELSGHDFFMFKDITTDNVAVVYKRKDGNYGIIEMI